MTINFLFKEELEKTRSMLADGMPIGRPHILWSMNCWARAITKWNKACDNILARLISCVQCASGYRQYCHVGNTASQSKLGLFQDAVKCVKTSYWQKQPPSMAGRSGLAASVPTPTFAHEPRVEDAKRTFRRGCKVNICKPCPRGRGAVLQLRRPLA